MPIGYYKTVLEAVIEADTVLEENGMTEYRKASSSSECYFKFSHWEPNPACTRITQATPLYARFTLNGDWHTLELNVNDFDQSDISETSFNKQDNTMTVIECKSIMNSYTKAPYAFSVLYEGVPTDYRISEFGTKKYNTKTPHNNLTHFAFSAPVVEQNNDVGLVKILDYGFFSCKNLVEVIVPSSLQIIGAHAFAYCNQLTTISTIESDSSISGQLPSSLVTIDESAFKNCDSLRNIELNFGLKKLGMSAFRGCSNLNSIIIPSSLTEIGEATFGECTSLTNIKIDDTLAPSPYQVKDNCLIDTQNKVLLQGLFCDEYDDLPSGITTFGSYCFARNSYIPSEIVFRNSTIEIHEGAFSNCDKLERVSFPNSLTSLGNACFGWCENLVGSANRSDAVLKLPNSLKHIGDHAFVSGKFEELHIPSATTIEANAFKDTTNLRKVVFTACYDRAGNLLLPNIDASAFNGAGIAGTPIEFSVPWAETEVVENFPWGATKYSVNYSVKGDNIND
jgi:hypothetical protein